MPQPLIITLAILAYFAIGLALGMFVAKKDNDAGAGMGFFFFWPLLVGFLAVMSPFVLLLGVFENVARENQPDPYDSVAFDRREAFRQLAMRPKKPADLCAYCSSVKPNLKGKCGNCGA